MKRLLTNLARRLAPAALLALPLLASGADQHPLTPALALALLTCIAVLLVAAADLEVSQ